MATLSEDDGLIEAFRSGEDLHTFVAMRAFGLPADRGDPRDAPADQGHVVRTRLRAVRVRPLRSAEDLGGRGARADGGVLRAVRRGAGLPAAHGRPGAPDGYTETVFGRRRYVPDLTSDNRQKREMAERIALNAPIQGSAADIIKVAMLHVQRRIEREGLRSKMLLQVHDELVCEVAAGEQDAMTTLLREEMSGAYPLSVPLEVSVGAGKTGTPPRTDGFPGGVTAARLTAARTDGARLPRLTSAPAARRAGRGRGAPSRLSVTLRASRSALEGPTQPSVERDRAPSHQLEAVSDEHPGDRATTTTFWNATAVLITSLIGLAIAIIFVVAYVQIIRRAGYSGWWVLDRSSCRSERRDAVRLRLQGMADPARAPGTAWLGQPDPARSCARRRLTRTGADQAFSVTKIAVPGKQLAAQRRPLAPLPGNPSGQAGSTTSYQPQPGGDDLPDPVAHRPVVLDVGGHARSRRPPRTASGRSRTGSRAGRPGPDRPGTPSASGGSTANTHRPPGRQHPGDLLHGRRRIRDERDRPERGERQIEAAGRERQLAGVGLHERHARCRFGRAAADGVRQHPGRQVERHRRAHPARRGSATHGRRAAAHLQRAAAGDLARAAARRDSRRFSGHHTRSASPEEVAVLGVIRVGVGIPPAPVGPGGDAGWSASTARGRVGPISGPDRPKPSVGRRDVTRSMLSPVGGDYSIGWRCRRLDRALWVCAVSEWSRPHSSRPCTRKHRRILEVRVPLLGRTPPG